MSTYDPIDLRGQESEREETEARKRLRQEVEDSDLRWLMNSGRGRRIVWRLFEFAGVNRISFDPNAAKMAFNEGNRNFGNFILGQIMDICPELYVLMLKEHRPKKKEKHGDGDGTKSN